MSTSDLRAALQRLVNAMALLLSEQGHAAHAGQTDPETMCLDCWELREAEAVLTAPPPVEPLTDATAWRAVAVERDRTWGADAAWIQQQLADALRAGPTTEGA